MSSTGESAREMVSQSSTVIAAVRPLRHDLHGAAFGAGNFDPHQPIAELFDHRLGDSGDARGQPRLDDEPRFGRCGSLKPHSCATCRFRPFGNKKERARRTHSQNPFGYEGV